MSPLLLGTIVINMALGLVYVSYAFLTIADLRRNRASRGGSHLAYGFIAIMLTCGPHHLDHALHLLAGHEVPGGLDLLVVATGLPTGLVWFLLRVEALRGGRGDRQISNELVIDTLRTVAAVAFVLVSAAVLAFDVEAPGWGGLLVSWRMLPNALLVVLYLVIGAILLRTQLRRYRVRGTWSLSGLGITGVFPTCAAMHAVWLGYVASGRYEPEGHLLVIDSLGVPAALYFIVVAFLLSEGRLPDWTDAASDVAKPVGADEAELEDMLQQTGPAA